MAIVVTTYLSGSHLNGTLYCNYVWACLDDAGEFQYSRVYSTAAGVRRALKRRGVRALPGVYQGHDDAKRALLAEHPRSRVLEGEG